MATIDWLVVGLGNPEDEYGGTRHNIGADFVQFLAEQNHRSLDVNKRIHCREAQVQFLGENVGLVVPMSWMNTSGDPVQQAARWHKVSPDHIVVAHDDLDVELGRLKVKSGGGAGGHNGLRDLDRALGTRDYLRLRIGIGRPPGRMAGKDFVLRRFAPAERTVVDVSLEQAVDALGMMITAGLAEAQNAFH